jgi:hypothetical protein
LAADVEVGYGGERTRVLRLAPLVVFQDNAIVFLTFRRKLRYITRTPV